MINEYKKHLPSFQRFIERFEGKNKYDLISEYSASSMVPVIAIYIFYGKIKGFDDDLIRKIKNICEFYDYNFDEIMNEINL